MGAAPFGVQSRHVRTCSLRCVYILAAPKRPMLTHSARSIEVQRAAYALDAGRCLQTTVDVDSAEKWTKKHYFVNSVRYGAIKSAKKRAAKKIQKAVHFLYKHLYVPFVVENVKMSRSDLKYWPILSLLEPEYIADLRMVMVYGK